MQALQDRWDLMRQHQPVRHATENQAAEELGQLCEQRDLTAKGAEALTSVTVRFVDSPSMAAEREAVKLIAPAPATK